MEEMLKQLIDRLETAHSLSTDEYAFLIRNRTALSAAYAAERAVRLRKEIYGSDIYIRGLIEISNYCKNNCLYCGIRRGNKTCERYRLSPEQILECCAEGHALGFRTFVLQGGEDPGFSDSLLCETVRRIRSRYPDCAVTLSVGEKSPEVYRMYREAGAERYLLRHETADPAHYQKLHPAEMSWSHRMDCLRALRNAGFQVGCGFMVGSPFQTAECLAADLKFLEEFRPEMCGIGPFLPHHGTPFRHEPAGTPELTVYLLPLIRLILPGVLLPATTALGTVAPDGRERGILAGANVIMPNLSPVSVRKKYELYDNKLCTGSESARNLDLLRRQMEKAGYRIVTGRGDPRG
jgi:biotin synthase